MSGRLPGAAFPCSSCGHGVGYHDAAGCHYLDCACRQVGPATLPVGSVGPEDAAALVDPSPDPRSTIVSDTSTTEAAPAGIVAHMYLAQLVHRVYDKDAADVTFQAVGRGEQNKTWAAATPAGQLTLTIKNPAAAAIFDRGSLGDEYEVTIRRLPGRTP